VSCTGRSRSVVVDLDSEVGRREFAALAAIADVVLDGRPRTYLADRALGYAELERLNPRLVYGRITPFGDVGPWADLTGSDLVHLALGGMMMTSGYDPGSPMMRQRIGPRVARSDMAREGRGSTSRG
jgi:crotonobetainyl-CoA:carnitine CoA-transferase CaiB-like acyl-CoA transferase